MSSTTHICPSAPDTYAFSTQSGSICLYTRSGETTRTATTTIDYLCLSTPRTFTYSHKTGATCHYTRTTTTKLPATYVPPTTTTTTSSTTTTTTTTQPVTTTTTTTTTQPVTTTTTTQPATIAIRPHTTLRPTPTPTTTTTTTTTQPAATTTTTTTIVIEGLQANGHSPGSTGQALIKWEAVTGATKYKILYGRHKVSVRPGEVVIPATATSITITGLQLTKLYDIVLIAYKGTKRLAQSDTINTYPTSTGAVAGDKVGSMPIVAYRKENNRYGYYSYKLCRNIVKASPNDLPRTVVNVPTLTTTTSTTSTSTTTTTTQVITRTQINQIEAGVNAWATATNSTYYHQLTTKCEGNELLRNRENRAKVNLIRILIESDKDKFCTKNSGACIDHFDPINGEVGIPDNGELSVSQIFISELAKTSNQHLGCSELHQLTLHEAGHAYGLHHPGENDLSVMSARTLYNNGLCDPTELDIVAIKAIYQSRPRPAIN